MLVKRLRLEGRLESCSACSCGKRRMTAVQRWIINEPMTVHVDIAPYSHVRILRSRVSLGVPRCLVSATSPSGTSVEVAAIDGDARSRGKAHLAAEFDKPRT